jgi:hypothetical protein
MTAAIPWKCPVCRIRANVPAHTPRIFCACGYVQLHGATPGLGDRLAAGLAHIGITHRRIRTWKRALGLAPKCGCHRRQQALNNLGDSLGITD